MWKSNKGLKEDVNKCWKPTSTDGKLDLGLVHKHCHSLFHRPLKHCRSGTVQIRCTNRKAWDPSGRVSCPQWWLRRQSEGGRWFSWEPTLPINNQYELLQFFTFEQFQKVFRFGGEKSTAMVGQRYNAIYENYSLPDLFSGWPGCRRDRGDHRQSVWGGEGEVEMLFPLALFDPG